MAKEPTYYKLTTAQNIMYVSQRYSMNKAIIDINTMLHFDCEMDEKLLMQALYLALLRNESSRVRLHKVGKEIKQYLSDQAPDPFVVLDYSDRTEEELTADLNAWARTPFPNKSMDTQLYVVRMIKEPSGFWGLSFCVSHLAFDAYALMAMASDAVKIYTALRDGGVIPKYKGDYLRLCETDWEMYENGKIEKNMEYWMNEVFEREPAYTEIDPDKPLRDKGKRTGRVINLLNSSATHYNYTMPAEINKKVLERAAEMHISPQCFYLLAVRSMLSKNTNDETDVMIMSTVARRANLLQKRSGGTRVLANPLPMFYPNDMLVKDALNKMATTQMDLYAHYEVLCDEIIRKQFKEKWGTPEMHGYAPMSITYNPYAVQLPEGIKAHLTTYGTGANTMNCYLTIMALDDSGDLNFNYDCCNYATTPDSARKMHEHITKALKAIVENPEMTLIELNRL